MNFSTPNLLHKRDQVDVEISNHTVFQKIYYQLSKIVSEIVIDCLFHDLNTKIANKLSH